MTTPPQKPPMAPHDNKSMHPQDKRNLIIFIVLSLTLWFAFDKLVLAPKAEAYKQAREQALKNAPNPDLIAHEDKILPREERLTEAQRIKIESPEINGSISLKGGRIDDIILNKYYTDLNNTDHVVLMSPSGADQSHYAENGWLPADAGIKVPGPATVWSVQGNPTLTPKSPVTLTWSNGAGLIFEKTYSIDEHFLISVTQRVINKSGKDVDLYPYASLTRRGIPSDYGSGIAYEGPLGYVGDDMHEISYSDLEKESKQSFTALNGWIGFGEKYWLSAIVPSQTSEHTYNFQSVPNKEKPENTIYQVDERGTAKKIASGDTEETTTHFFIGAKKLSLLNDYSEELGVRHFDLAIDFGVLYFLTKPLYILLIFLNSQVGNFGVAIILLTIAVRGAIFPLANKSYRSFASLRKVSPKMAEIKARYGSDKQRMQQELIKLYETEQVNPLAGCFPLLLQIPIFFAVYKVITIAVEMRHAPFFGWIHDLSAIDPVSAFNLFGLLPYDVPSFMQIGPWSIAMLLILLFQKHLNPPAQDQIQRDIANYMPWIMTYMLSHFASGLVIYWTFSNLISVIQQAVIMRSMGVPIYLIDPAGAKEHRDATQVETAKVLEDIKKEQEEAEAASTKSGEGAESKTDGDKKPS